MNPQDPFGRRYLQSVSSSSVHYWIMWRYHSPDRSQTITYGLQASLRFTFLQGRLNSHKFLVWSNWSDCIQTHNFGQVVLFRLGQCTPYIPNLSENLFLISSLGWITRVQTWHKYFGPNGTLNGTVIIEYMLGVTVYGGYIEIFEGLFYQWITWQSSSRSIKKSPYSSSRKGSTSTWVPLGKPRWIQNTWY